MSHPNTIDLPNALLCVHCGNLHVDPVRVDRCERCYHQHELEPVHVKPPPIDRDERPPARFGFAGMLFAMGVGMSRLIARSARREEVTS